MKLNCEIVQDLLPLYEDDLCSPGSRAAVEEHLGSCPQCRARLERTRAVPAPEEPGPGREDQAVARSLRKVRRRWWASLAAAVLVIPLVLMTVNQIRGQGLCYTSLDEAAVTALYLHRLRSGDCEAAADMLDYEEVYNDIQQALAMSPQDHAKAFEAVTIGGETWYRSFAVEDVWLEQEDPWAYMIRNRITGVMVPQAEFDRVMAQEEDWYTQGCWRPLVTQWGTYYVESGFYHEVYETAADYCFGFFLVPEAIYLEGKQALAANGQDVYDSTWDYYGGAADMSLEEFTEYVRADFIRRQATAPEWTAAGFSDGYYVHEEGHWIIEWNLKLEGKRFSVAFTVEGGKLRHVSSSTPDQVPEMDTAVESLDLRWPQ